MRVKKFINKQFNVIKLKEDMKIGETSGVHYFEKGCLDEKYDTVELILRNDFGYAFAFDIFLEDQVVKKIERVKFQWECGGWRSKNIVIKRFPIMFYKVEEPAEEVLEMYCC
jgi:hypothetical protein